VNPVEALRCLTGLTEAEQVFVLMHIAASDPDMIAAAVQALRAADQDAVKRGQLVGVVMCAGEIHRPAGRLDGRCACGAFRAFPL
jgi:hypothetical protein